MSDSSVTRCPFQNGDEFMNRIQPIASKLPYMTCVGNHGMSPRAMWQWCQKSTSANSSVFPGMMHEESPLMLMYSVHYTTSVQSHLKVRWCKKEKGLPELYCLGLWLGAVQDRTHDARFFSLAWGERRQRPSDVNRERVYVERKGNVKRVY